MYWGACLFAPGSARAALSRSVRRHAGGRNHHRLDRATGIEAKFIDTDHPVITIGLAQRAAVIDDVVLAGGGCAQHGVVAGAGGDRRILLEDLGR